jgi:hypothetical protein
MSDSVQPAVNIKEAMRLTKARLSRVTWALETYGHLIADAVRADTSPEAREVEKSPVASFPEHVARMIQERADPTVAKTMTGWLIKQYAEGRLRLEDLGSANDTLKMFEKHSKKLPKGKQDLRQYPSLAKVWEVVSPIADAEQDKLSGKAQKALDRDKAYSESRILSQDPDGFTVAVPLSEFAAKWWGKGTRWCTAAEKDNQFWQYHKIAPLIVVLIPELKEKGKFQLWVTKNDVQFMDAADEPVSEVLITEYWPRFEAVISFALRQNGGALLHVPEDLRTEELCRIAVAQNAGALLHVPADLLTDEIYRIAVAENGWALEYVPEKLRTDEMCRIAIAQDSRALGYVPGRRRTDELCRFAVAKNGLALRNVPPDLRTEEMCRSALAQDGWALQYVPQNLLTDDLCRIAVAQNGEALCHVPEKLRTAELYGIAVAQNGWALEYIPERLQTDEMCCIAVAQNGRALRYVPEPLRTDELCKIAVTQDGRALEYLPEKLCTDEMCRIAVAQNANAFYHVPEKLLTEEMCRIAVAQNARALNHVPRAMRDRISALIPPPVPGWNISLLDELVSFLDTASPSAPSGPRHA